MFFLVPRNKSHVELPPNFADLDSLPWKHSELTEVYTRRASQKIHLHLCQFPLLLLLLLHIPVRLLLILSFQLFFTRALGATLLILCQNLFIILIGRHHIMLLSLSSFPILYQKPCHILEGNYLTEMMALEQNKTWGFVSFHGVKKLVSYIYRENESR